MCLFFYQIAAPVVNQMKPDAIDLPSVGSTVSFVVTQINNYSDYFVQLYSEAKYFKELERKLYQMCEANNLRPLTRSPSKYLRKQLNLIQLI